MKKNDYYNSALFKIYLVFKRFGVLERENIEFSQFGMRDNVAQLAVLEVEIFFECFTNFFFHVYALTDPVFFWVSRQLRKSNKSRKILLGNIHVLYNPNQGDVKLGQVSLDISICISATRAIDCHESLQNVDLALSPLALRLQEIVLNLSQEMFTSISLNI